MREIQASEAKTHLPQLLDDVERGETLIITRHGRRIARMVPEVDRRQEAIDKALAAILEFRKRTGSVTLGELLSARDEGRKSGWPSFSMHPSRRVGPLRMKTTPMPIWLS